MGAGQIACAHQELANYFTTGKTESLFKQFDPFLFDKGMMVVKPSFEGAELPLQLLYATGVFDGRLDFEPVADNPCILEQPVDLLLFVMGYRSNIEPVEGLEKVVLFIEDGGPGKTSLIDFQHKPGEELVVIIDGEAIFLIMIVYMYVILIHYGNGFTIARGFLHI